MFVVAELGSGDSPICRPVALVMKINNWWLWVKDGCSFAEHLQKSASA
jgi:hypothetical protein